MSSTYSATCRKAFSPAKGGARPPAIDLASGHSTALPAYLIGVNIICKRTYHTSTFKDLYIPQAFSGSTPNTRTLFRAKWAKAVATPAKSPPPPQQTRTIVTSGTCWQISYPRLPYPAIKCRSSNGCRKVAPTLCSYLKMGLSIGHQKC